ncbi:MAG TPA: sulfite exporter TauE/SafE family protein [Vicinamibacterales bacterium]|nr:sulfite exporter TauE/SafE family protein [Vicinamibacterales bacterium]
MSSPGGILLITFGAAIVNGALGYGFSSITVPLALFLIPNRVLNPALVAIEVALNAYVLWVNRAAVPSVGRRVAPLAVGLVPGVVAGTLVVAHVSPAWVKFATYAALLPVILIQASGFRRPIRSERAAGAFFGVGLGTLYSVTTISGPPLAVALNNQGLSKDEFRAALGVVRLAESSMTAAAYLAVGLFTRDSLALIPQIVPSVFVGVPIGAVLIRHLSPETFRRICMSFDAWVVGFGLSALLRELRIVTGAAAFGVLGAVAAVDGWLLYRYFYSHSRNRA